MEVNQSRPIASEVYLIEKWKEHSGPTPQRRNEIFHEFVKLGMRERWQWHARAERYEITAEDKKLLNECRDWPTRCIALYLGDDTKRVMVTNRDIPVEENFLKYRTDWEGEPMIVCKYEGGDPFDVLPELVYSMTAFDDPDDVEEARQSSDPPDQSLWVSGVFWIDDRVVWVDEFGVAIREKDCTREESKEAADAFEEVRPFESTWWMEATRVGKYATDEWHRRD